MRVSERERMLVILQELQEVTQGCRDNMHEPDEQGIRAEVVGDHLDNAFGTHIGENIEYDQEFVVRIIRDGKTNDFNLADLIALARMTNLS